MLSVPKNWNDAKNLGGKALWVFSRIHFLGVLVGVVGTITVQLLTGFWEFRSEHQEIVRDQYEETLLAHAAFQRQIDSFNAIFEVGEVSDGEEESSDGGEELSYTVRQIQEARTYDRAAQAYIREINETARLLPSVHDEVADYIDAIAALNKYYVVASLPDASSLERTIFYGQFRVDLDKYIKTRDAYLKEVAGQVGSYRRAIRNS